MTTGSTRDLQPNAPTADSAVGRLVRAWREKRRLSQLSLALEAGISARHLSFVETGRSRPSAELVMTLADYLQVPLRERNELLLAAGFAPRYPELELTSPDMAAVHRQIERLLAAHEPYPGVALDRHWNVVLANASARRMMLLLPPSLSQPTINMFRASLHPDGFSAVTSNFDAWGRYLVGELERLAASTFDAGTDALLAEVLDYPNVRTLRRTPARPVPAEERLLVPCVLSLGGARLSLFTTLMTFGSPRNVTLAELTIELFYPADEATAESLRAMAG
ncbi:MAG: helix-turn-helix transcriptional regulator [Cytophagaceae bacterium]|nr:helix-turn-helix transcriptional regulator [Gemmatimonadaceae bacterium]